MKYIIAALLFLSSNHSQATVQEYNDRAFYHYGDHVQVKGSIYQCIEPQWCNITTGWAYSPGVGRYWQKAWRYQPAETAPIRH